MNSEKSSSVRLFQATGMLVFFTAAAAVIIIAWGPLIPEAIAVDLPPSRPSFSAYIALHESWHMAAASGADARCAK